MTPVKELHYVNQSIRVWRAEPLYARALANIDRVNRQRDRVEYASPRPGRCGVARGADMA